MRRSGDGDQEDRYCRHLSGRGIVFQKDGKKLGEADYEINVQQTIIDVGTKDDPDDIIPHDAKNFEGTDPLRK